MAVASVARAPRALRVLFLGLQLLVFVDPAGAADGCYDQLDTHRCDCDTTNETCQQRGHIWTDRCTSCEAPSCNKEMSWGCFNTASHRCVCATSEGTCEGKMDQGYVWTHECWSCCHHSEWGCFVHQGQPMSGCHCDVAESQCSRTFDGEATWTHQCHVCADKDYTDPTAAPPETASDADNDSDQVVLVVIIIVAGVVVLAAIGAVVYFWQARGPSKHVQNPPQSNVVGMPVTEGTPAVTAGTPVVETAPKV